VSVGPPAANGTIILIGLLGYSAAQALVAVNAANAIAATRVAILLIAWFMSAPDFLVENPRLHPSWANANSMPGPVSPRTVRQRGTATTSRPPALPPG